MLPSATIYTDEYAVYNSLKRNGYTDHETITHKTGTNTVEGFWSLVKRGSSGTRSGVRQALAGGYLNEYVWRYSHRDQHGEGPAPLCALLLRAATTRV